MTPHSHTALAAILVLAFNLAGVSSMAATDLPLIPAPSAWRPGEGVLAKAVIETVHFDDERVAPVAELTAEHLGLSLRAKGKAGLTLVLNRGDDSTLSSTPLAEVLDPRLQIEGYRLEIRASGMTLTAESRAGLYRGVQTVRQLMAVAGHQVPCGEIEDQPAFPWRGMLLDCGRHFMPLDVIKETIDQLAYHKFNVLHWHLTEDQGWRMEVPAYPDLSEVAAWRQQTDDSRYGGYYTVAEMKEIVAYAAARYITVVPEIELPGHAQAALAAYPELSCRGVPLDVQTQWGIFKDVYCAGNDEVFTFLENVFAHALEVFPSQYIHIGGDECPKDRWQKCAKCQARIAAEGLSGEHELQSWFIRRMENWLREHGRRLIGWDEILEGGLAPQATVQSWRGTRGAIAAAQQGHDTIVSPTSHCYFDYDVATLDLRQVYTFDPVPSKLTESETRHVLGGEMNLWSEYIPPARLQNMMFPRMTAMAECLWTRPPERDFGEFLGRMRPHMAVLKSMGVESGPADRPVEFSVEVDPADGTTRVRLAVDEKLAAALEGHEVVLRKAQVASRAPESYRADQRVEDMGLFAVPFDADEMPPGGYLEMPGTTPDDRIVAVQMFAEGEPYGTPAVIEQTGHLALGKVPGLEHQPSERYPGGGPAGLVNGVRGTREFRDGLWLGFESTDLIATIDLGGPQPVNEMSIRFYQGTPAWIFLPSKVEFQISDDGVRWDTVAVVSHDVSPRIQDRLIHEFVAQNLNRQARWVRVMGRSLGICPEWHWGAGQACWLFADEIVVR